jgi:hypothetical protein
MLVLLLLFSLALAQRQSASFGEFSFFLLFFPRLFFSGLKHSARPPGRHPCSEDAKAKALALLRFHSEGDDRAAVDDVVRQLPSIRNPTNPRQSLDVLEVSGYVYRAQYRMRILYARVATSPTACAVLGQEIMELSSF